MIIYMATHSIKLAHHDHRALHVSYGDMQCTYVESLTINNCNSIYRYILITGIAIQVYYAHCNKMMWLANMQQAMLLVQNTIILL